MSNNKKPILDIKDNSKTVIKNSIKIKNSGTQSAESIMPKINIKKSAGRIDITSGTIV